MLTNGNAELKRLLLDRIEFAAGHIGWTVHRDDLFAFAEKFLQSLFRECGLSDENDAHRLLLPFLNSPRTPPMILKSPPRKFLQRFTYVDEPILIQCRASPANSFFTFAGAPAASTRGGILVWGTTTLPAAISASSPIPPFSKGRLSLPS